MALKLKAVLARLKQPQSALARKLGVSDSLIGQIVNHGEWPKSLDTQDLQERIRIYLEKHGASDADVSSAFEEVSEPRANAARSVPKSRNTTESNQEETMLLRKQGLSQAARRHFGLFRDPFQDDIQSHEDMFVSPDIRYVRESMLQTAKHGGMLAVIAESGAGKTTLLRDLDDRIVREGLPKALDGVLHDYLAFKLKRQDKALAEVIDASGVDVLRARLTVSSGRPNRESVSLLYPLAVSNLLCAAMNLAAELGVPVVTADVVKGV